MQNNWFFLNFSYNCFCIVNKFRDLWIMFVVFLGHQVDFIESKTDTHVFLL